VDPNMWGPPLLDLVRPPLDISPYPIDRNSDIDFSLLVTICSCSNPTMIIPESSPSQPSLFHLTSSFPCSTLTTNLCQVEASHGRARLDWVYVGEKEIPILSEGRLRSSGVIVIIVIKWYYFLTQWKFIFDII